jgi:HEPN domain-containing protein
VLMEPSYTSVTQDFVREVCSANKGVQASVILIGSVARSTHTSHSDLDLLVIGEKPALVRRRPDKLHVQTMTVKQFSERLRAGDDFAAWCVRYGVPILASQPWLDIVSSPDAGTWPDWHKKIRHAARRLMLAATVLETGDVEAAAEESLYAVSHTARAILLKEGVFPLSRPEIISQLREANHENLARVLQKLSYEAPTKAALNRALLYVKRILVSMDRPLYREYVQSHQQRLLAKQGGPVH